jgi:hypothetical protein
MKHSHGQTVRTSCNVFYYAFCENKEQNGGSLPSSFFYFAKHEFEIDDVVAEAQQMT